MFCPKCSQEQFSDKMQFCKNCGFQLNAVRELLANDGVREPAKTQKQISAFSHRDMSIGAAGMFVFAFFAAMLTIDVPASAITPIVFLVIAAVIFLTAINLLTMAGNYFLNRKDKSTAENYLSSKNTDALAIEDKKREKFLPSTQSIPASILLKDFDTNGLERPPSVTEHTTKHLKMK